jgi:hypothetical protein
MLAMTFGRKKRDTSSQVSQVRTGRPGQPSRPGKSGQSRYSGYAGQSTVKKKLREIPLWTTVARTKRRGGRKIPTPTSFGSAPPLSTSEFGAFRHGFFTVSGQPGQPVQTVLFTSCMSVRSARPPKSDRSDSGVIQVTRLIDHYNNIRSVY